MAGNGGLGGIDPKLLAHPDAQRIMAELAGLLNGTKRLVIESKMEVERRPNGTFTDITDNLGEPTGEKREVCDFLQHYKHTFRVEDCK